MTETAKCDCGRPSSGAWLCTSCATTLAYAIANVAAYHDDLDTVAARETRYGDGQPTGGGRTIGKTQPLPIDMRFAGSEKGTRLRDETRASIVGWVRILTEEQNPHAGPTCDVVRPRRRGHRQAPATTCEHLSCRTIRRTCLPADTVRSMCHYLDRQHAIIEWSQWAPEMLRDLLSLERRLRRMVDRPPDTWFAGVCSCKERLHATPGRPTVTCRACGLQYDVAQCRTALLKEAQEYLVTASEAAWALLVWTDYAGSERKLVDLIRKWRDRERVQTRGTALVSGRDRDLYRLGDLQALVIEHAQYEQERRLAATRAG